MRLGSLFPGHDFSKWQNIGIAPVTLAMFVFVLCLPYRAHAEVLFESLLGGSDISGLTAGASTVFTSQAVFPVSAYTCDTIPNWTIDEIDFVVGKPGIGGGTYKGALWFTSVIGPPDIVSTNDFSMGSFEGNATRTLNFDINIRDACNQYSTGGISHGGRPLHLLFWGVRPTSGATHRQGRATSNQMGELAPATYIAKPGLVTDNHTFTVQIRGHSDIATSTTWESGHVYKVSGNTVVQAGSTLTIEPGAIVKFDTATTSNLIVNGTLDVIGAAASTTYFTSWKDDSIGGDSNIDGSTTTPAAGDWGRIQVNAGGIAQIEHAEIR